MESEKIDVKRSRRAILAAAAGAAALTLTRPLDAVADAGDPLILGSQDNTSADPTHLVGRLFMNATAAPVGQGFLTPVFGAHNGGEGEGQVGTYGSSFRGVGVHGESSGVLGPRSAGVRGQTDTPLGVGVAAIGTVLDGGTGLYVQGKVRVVNRSGRATISADKSFVDVDLRQKGGLSGTPLCFANLTSYRSGVHVAAVRPNYPVRGKLRIQMNRAVSSNTNVAWLVLN